MKKYLLFLTLMTPMSVYCQASKVDSAAVYLLDHMSDVIGDLGSCSYHVSTSTDVDNYRYGLEKQFAEHDVYMVGPDKMLVQSRGHKGHRGYWYDGKQVTYYSYDHNNYATIDAPSNIISTMDSVYKMYDLEFPAADFFYPSFTSDILTYFDTLIFLGIDQINGQDCFHILADNAAMHMQLWISNDALCLPVKLVIGYKDQKQTPQYEATFSNWQLNPESS